MLLYPSTSPSASSSSSSSSSSSATSSAPTTTSLFTPSRNLNSPKYPCTSRPLSIPILKSFQSHNGTTNANAATITTSSNDRRDNLEGFLVRRPAIQPDTQNNSNNNDDEGALETDSGSDDDKSALDRSLEKLSKKLPMFQPGKAVVFTDKPLKINLDLALYKAKILTRTFQFSQAQDLLQQCVRYWPEDGRLYVALGKILRKQSKLSEASAVYDKGAQATQGENAYIWAALENEMGNVRKARELFDASTVADKKHIAAWHGWAVLELKQGNVQKVRNLLAKGIKFCGGNEYVY